MENQSWVRCPSCSEEWTKLRYCPFFYKGRKDHTYLCVECAEGVRAFEWINSNPEFEIPGIRINTFPFKIFREFNRAELGRRYFQTFVTYGAGEFKRTFTVTCQQSDDTGTPLIIIDSEEKDEKKYLNNSMQAWLFIRESLLNTEPRGKKSW